jgi:hypothetical protein
MRQCNRSLKCQIEKEDSENTTLPQTAAKAHTQSPTRRYSAAKPFGDIKKAAVLR